MAKTDEEMGTYIKDMYAKAQRSNPLKVMFKFIVTKAKEVRESNIERKLRVYRVQEAMQRKEAEAEAQPIVDELGVSMDDGIAYVLTQKKKEKRREIMSKVHEIATKIGDNYREEQETQKEAPKSVPKGKKEQKRVEVDKVGEMVKGSFGMIKNEKLN